jgi:photosystem II stability/assembly factor-like uncharacterized protein
VGRSQITHNAVRRQATNPSTALRAIACPSRTVCYAAGDFGNAVKTTDGGDHWTALGPSLVRQSRAGSITTLACASTTICYAGLVATSQSRAMVISTHDGGQSWAATLGVGLATITCPRRTVCFAAGSQGRMQVTRDGGRTWTRQRTPITGQPYEIQHLVCRSTEVCYATAMGPSEPPPHPSSNVGALLVTSDGGRSWRVTRTDPSPFALACPTPSDCLALLAGALVRGTVPTLVTHDGGRAWTEQTTLPDGDWDAVTCGGTTCYVVSSSGRIAVSRDGAHTWQEEATPTFNRLDAITCTAAASCYAAGLFGTILTRQPANH